MGESKSDQGKGNLKYEAANNGSASAGKVPSLHLQSSRGEHLVKIGSTQRPPGK